jgi:isochorismate hydrolase
MLNYIFKNPNIDKKGNMPDFLNQISQYNIHELKPRPSKCALLVIDMQRYYT